MSRCVVNVAIHHAYHIGQERLAKSLGGVGVPLLKWTEGYPPGSPTHEDSPYEFKYHAILAALERGYTTVLWCDADAWAVRSVEPLFELIERQGHFIYCTNINKMRDEASLGFWSSDRCLTALGISREYACSVPLVAGKCFGFDLTWPDRLWLVKEMIKLGSDGLFCGPKVAAGHEAELTALAGRGVGKVSEDGRVLGHSHDESVLSALANRHGLVIDGPGVVLPYGHEAEGTIVTSCGL